MVRRGRERVGLLKVIQQFGQTARIPEKEPSHHRLKSRGLRIKRGLLRSGAPASSVAASPHQALLLGAKVGLQLLQGLGLGFRPHPGNHPVVQFGRAARGLAPQEPLVQLPYGIAQPSQLERGQIGLRNQNRQCGQPVG